MVKEIRLTHDQVAIVDDEWYDVLCQHRWFCTRKPDGKKPVYAARRISAEGYAHGKIVRMHHFILPPIQGLYTDHINRNGLDNRSENLRYATVTQNNRNTPARHHGKSKYKGVSLGKTPGTWRANIYLNRRQTSLGSFNTEDEAAAAYNAAAYAAWGEYAWLNDVGDIHYSKRPHYDKSERVGRSGIPGIVITYERNIKKWYLRKNRKRIMSFNTLEEAQKYAATLPCGSTV